MVVIVWVSPKADSEVRVWGQVVNLGGPFRKGSGERETRKGRSQQSALLSIVAVDHWSIDPLGNLQPAPQPSWGHVSWDTYPPSH